MNEKIITKVFYLFSFCFIIAQLIICGYILFGLRGPDNTDTIKKLETELKTSIDRCNTLTKQLETSRTEATKIRADVGKLQADNNRLRKENSELGSLISKSIIGSQGITKTITGSITIVESIEKKFKEAENKDYR